MQIARVIGDLTATQKHASHTGQKLLLVQVTDLDGAPRGNPVVALDAVNAGIGDRVLVVLEGYCSMLAVGKPNSPIDYAVVGIVDHVELEPPPEPSPPEPPGGKPPSRRRRESRA